MQTRSCEIFTGKVFKVPTHIVRIDSSDTHGWQLRLGSWTLFSDGGNSGKGARAALQLAKTELAQRMAKMPAPTGLRNVVREGKNNDMPLGISGPVKRQRAEGGAVQYYLQVTFPVAGQRSTNRSVYIATENTLSQEKYDTAMAKAMALRDSGVRKFKLASTKAMRASAQALAI